MLYEVITVLKHVTFNVETGDFIYLIGKVGSGKSSLLKTIYAELPVTEGVCTVLGYNLVKIRRKDIPLLRRKLGIVFQDFQLLHDRNVQENLEFVLKATKWKDKTKINHRVNEVLAQVDMANKGYKMPHELSGGEQQRIVIARALLNSPKLILADEPTGNLDPETSMSIMLLLHTLKEQGITVIMATHNLNVIDKFPGKVFKCEFGEFTQIA